MNIHKIEDERLGSPALDVVESPRKRMRLDNSSRKSWSLMDRRTDSDVLHEMGVSLLDPEEEHNESNMHRATLKRKHDIENVNPNINSSLSRGKFSPKSPRGKSSPGAGPSRVKSPRSCDKSKSDLDLSQATYVNDEETPLAQSVSVTLKHTSGFGTAVKKQCEFGLAPPLCPPALPGADSFSALADELVLCVLRWLPKRTLTHCMLVCKRWHRVSCDETLWQRLDLGNKALATGALGRILTRQPAVLRLASSEIGEWHPNSPIIQSRIQYLDLSMCSIDYTSLEQLLSRCSGLKKLSLESVKLSLLSQELIGKCVALETLNLAMAQGITPEGLAAVLDGCTGISSLNISWCNLSEATLSVLVSKLPPKLSRLNVSGARSMTDENVQALSSRCPRLLELDLSDCSLLGVSALLALLPLARLEHLALSRCYLLPPHALTKLSRMCTLQYVEVWGTLQHASLAALRAALPAVTLNQYMFRILTRQPAVLRLASSEIGEWHPNSPIIQSRIQYLDLSMCSIDYTSLEQLLSRCSGLKKLSLESVKLSLLSQELIGKCVALETLNLAMAQGITPEGLAAVLDGCTGISSLNISWCNLSEATLSVLVSKLPPKLSRLNVSGARSMTDENVQALSSRCPRLLELDLSDCSLLGVSALLALLPLARLEHLALSRCYLLPPHALTKLSRMCTLQYVEVWGTLQHASLAALRAALPAVTLNQYMFSAIARPTVGTRRTSVWGLRTRD